MSIGGLLLTGFIGGLIGCLLTIGAGMLLRVINREFGWRKLRREDIRQLEAWQQNRVLRKKVRGE